MKIVLYTQRVERVESYKEYRDCADQRIPKFIQACGFMPVPIPNVIEKIDEYINIIKPTGIVLTGGNSLVQYGGNAPERDRTDAGCIRIAEYTGIPLYGFCRGMQSILAYYGHELQQIQDHSAVRHTIQYQNRKSEVNSYHNQGIYSINVRKPLSVLAQSEDGVAEWIQHENKKIEATMWHPERENPFCEWDIKRLKVLFSL